MDIISLEFVLLAIASIFVYYLLKQKHKIGYLALLSCGFIASFDYYLAAYVILFALFNFFIALNIHGSENKWLYRIGIIVNISQLVLLKYANFAIEPILRLFNYDVQLSQFLAIIIPIGISYFTLQGIGYLINVKMGWEKPEGNFLHLFLYFSFYPKFISGPIERSNHFLPQLKVNQEFNERMVTEGFRLALYGFLKKIAIANQLAPFITDAYANLGSGTGLSPWIVWIIQPLYLYFDFSGYTDIAVGIARAFGIKLLPNFNRPFLSENMTTFWKRFHMSLSSWFNDYVFRQTSFRYRKWGIKASVFAVFVTWILFGIWHGAGWNFMMLGFIQAIAVIYEFFTKRWRERIFSKFPTFLRRWLGRIFTYLFYGASLIFFFSPNLGTSFKFINEIIHFHGSSRINMEDKRIFLSAMAFIVIILIMEVLINDRNETFKKLQSIWGNNTLTSRILRYSVYYLIILIIFYFGKMQTEFIYFQF
jgi:D-alanyl-lipoteichoic acid acyltransferase DltB (MBOAT superfamily)